MQIDIIHIIITNHGERQIILGFPKFINGHDLLWGLNSVKILNKMDLWATDRKIPIDLEMIDTTPKQRDFYLKGKRPGV
jgi:hypothetical protein